MVVSKLVLTVAGVSLVTLSACAPRQSVMRTTQQAPQQAQMGVNGSPLYQTAQSTVNNNMPSADYIATGSIKSVSQSGWVTADPLELNDNNQQKIVTTPYTVQPGDTVYSIGRKFNARPVNIIAHNKMSSPDTLVVGQTIMVPNVTRQNLASADTSLTTGSINNNIVPAYPAPNKVQPQGQKYVVQLGDTFYSIGRKFNVHPEYIMGQNPGISPDQLSPGQVINVTSSNLNDQASISKPVIEQTSNKKGILDLPVQGSIKEGKNLRGILISATDGAAVKASADGQVIYVGNLNNYGNMILVRHENGLVTNYARLKRSFVKKGQKVTKGDLIAAAGASKDFQTADVLFEVRKGTKAVNPLQYIG